MATPTDQVVFKSEQLQNEAEGLRFALPAFGEHATGFVIRFRGKPYAYVNQCAHVSVALDWTEGEFFNRDKDYLICATHGGHHQPETGFCVMGPCKGKRLQALEVIEQNKEIVINTNSIKVK